MAAGRATIGTVSAVLLAATILLYDAVHKIFAFSPVIMAGCRFLLVLLAAFAPRLMAWVESNPGAVEHGLVRDFVNWYQPEALADTPASDQRSGRKPSWPPCV